MKHPFSLVLILLFGALHANTSWSQKRFSHADSLMGHNGPARSCYDVLHYDLHVEFDIANQQLKGRNDITFQLTRPSKTERLQLDLQAPMVLDSIVFSGKSINWKKDGNAYFIEVPYMAKAQLVSTYFHGSPRIAKHAPWDGGIVYAQDPQGQPWVSIACQGLGASCWFMCKDSQADEPDAADMYFTVPNPLSCVSNGRLIEKLPGDKTTTFHWQVRNPINAYNIIPYIGNYSELSETYSGVKGPLSIHFWALNSHAKQAKLRMPEIKKTLRAFEYWFGPYPFYEDGYQLVEAPYLGMEHQSAVAYGNGFQNGYLGMDLSGTGYGLKWDYIIVHESGHEWFGNNITTKDIADMWVHEGFTDYSETLYTEYYYGKEAASAYCLGIRSSIQNDKPIIGPYGVNTEGSGDMYYKGANMLHMIRAIANNDSLFHQLLVGLNTEFYHQTVTSEQVEAYIEKTLGLELTSLFDQYLRRAELPELVVTKKGEEMLLKWSHCAPDFRCQVVCSEGTFWVDAKTATAVKINPTRRFAIDPRMLCSIKQK